MTLSPDTRPEAERLLIEAWRRASPAEKIARIVSWCDALKRLQEAEIRHRCPEADDREVWLRRVSRWLGPELTRRVYGWDPDREGY